MGKVAALTHRLIRSLTLNHSPSDPLILSPIRIPSRSVTHPPARTTHSPTYPLIHARGLPDLSRTVPRIGINVRVAAETDLSRDLGTGFALSCIAVRLRSVDYKPRPSDKCSGLVCGGKVCSTGSQIQHCPPANREPCYPTPAPTARKKQLLSVAPLFCQDLHSVIYSVIARGIVFGNLS